MNQIFFQTLFEALSISLLPPISIPSPVLPPPSHPPHPPHHAPSPPQVQRKVVEEGFRLPQPQGCPEELYHLMQLCWAQRPNDRPQFSEVLKNYLEPLEVKWSR